MELLQKAKSWFGPPVPTKEEQIEQSRTALFTRQMGLTKNIGELEARNQLLTQQFITLPENDPYAQQLFFEIKKNNQQIQSLTNQRTLVAKSLENLNTSDSNVQLMTDIHASNQVVNNLVKESRNTIGASPQRVMEKLGSITEQTQEMSTLIEEASLNINKNDLVVGTRGSTSLNEEMAKYKQDLANASSQQRRALIVDSMPSVPLGSVSAPLPSPLPSYQYQSAPSIIPLTASNRGPPLPPSLQQQEAPAYSMDDWMSVVNAANKQS